MSGLSRERARQLLKARKLPVSRKLGTLPGTLVNRLVEFHAFNKHSNILGEAIQNRQERGVPLENVGYLNKHYSQVALQRLRRGGDVTVTADFDVPIVQELCDEVRAVAEAACRMRIGCLEGYAEISEHVDDPRQRRAIALLEGEQVFSLRAGDEYHRLDMRVGDLWFVNTAWPHRVVNPGTVPRLALLVDLPDLPATVDCAADEGNCA